jgi:hypothetical protein
MKGCEGTGYGQIPFLVAEILSRRRFDPGGRPWKCG